MKAPVVIEVSNVTKAFRLYNRNFDRVKEVFHPLRRTFHHLFCALSNVSFTVAKGEFLGIVGPNGSGKSTLLQVICGILKPTNGHVRTQGRISALLELGAGFNPEFSGRENIFLNAAILGLTRPEIDARFDEIVAFADIGEYLDQPVKHYSSGMAVRLAFAVQAHVDPEILIIDEAMAVGDSYFQAKCMRRMRQLVERGVTILFVTHAVETVPTICSRSIYLNGGRIRAIGSACSVVDTYLRDIRREEYDKGLIHEPPLETATCHAVTDGQGTVGAVELSRSGEVVFHIDPAFAERVRPYRYGTGGARVVALDLLGVGGDPKPAFGFREQVTVRAHIEIHKALDALNCCMILRNRHGVEIMHCTSREYGYCFPALPSGSRVIADIGFENVLKPMEAYSIHFTVNNTRSPDDNEILDLLELAAVFDVISDPRHPIWYLVWHPFHFNHYLEPAEAGSR